MIDDASIEPTPEIDSTGPVPPATRYYNDVTTHLSEAVLHPVRCSLEPEGSNPLDGSQNNQDYHPINSSSLEGTTEMDVRDSNTQTDIPDNAGYNFAVTSDCYNDTTRLPTTVTPTKTPDHETQKANLENLPELQRDKDYASLDVSSLEQRWM